MRLPVSLLALAALAPAGPRQGWLAVLEPVGVSPESGQVFIATQSTSASEVEARAREGAIVVLEGASPAAEALGFRATERRVVVRSLEDVHRPALRIVWEQPAEMAVFEVAAGALVFTRERHERVPLMAGLRREAGGILWMACSPGERGYDRYPYLVQALADLGLDPPFRARNLWVFFDSSYRLRADVEWFAERWRRAGISALHVAAWHYWEPDAQRDEWLRKLIEACHRRAILVYAWIEFPHVSERFWTEHPEWREKTAVLQDAHLDWRRLMNMADPACARAVEMGTRELSARFDWDGFNLGELYFESLEGAANPARLTPMNDVVRQEVRSAHGFDPLELFRPGGANEARLRRFLDYRAQLARRLQEEWIGRLESLRLRRPHLDLVLTHIDDRYDPSMRDKLGADAAGLLPVTEARGVTFLVEDPANLWHLGPQRYPDIAARYGQLKPEPRRLGIDINIVERYQNVYPTKQQTGVELFRLVNLAARSFPRVALYFESSILPADWALLPASAAVATLAERTPAGLTVTSPAGAGVRWKGGATVNGKPWPVLDGEQVWLPAGRHKIESGLLPALSLTDLNARLEEAESLPRGLRFVYTSSSRALALLSVAPGKVLIDGAVQAKPDSTLLRLPRGRHEVRLELD
jgi:hypothetical protein